MAEERKGRSVQFVDDFFQVSYSSFVPEDQRVTFTWNEINVFAKAKASKLSYLKCTKASEVTKIKQILKNGFLFEIFRMYAISVLFTVYGIAYSGEILAIMGSSGSGKTTLLNCLTFLSPPSIIDSGRRCINGVEVTRNVLFRHSAYVHQDDLFIGTLTVKEHLIFQALVRMSEEISYKERIARVEEVILELALTDCEHSLIGSVGRKKGISGGEKKRLAFASEILTNPKLMLCDEPTTGLDSHMAFTVMRVLKNMTLSGKTIITTIHQPSSRIFWNFDKLLLLAEGRTIFLGTPEEANSFFEKLEKPCPQNYNPADHFIQILSVEPEHEEKSQATIRFISNQYQNSMLGIKISSKAAGTKPLRAQSLHLVEDKHKDRKRYKVSWWSQFKALLWRTWLSTIREPRLIQLKFIQTFFIALLIGGTYFRQKLDYDGVININGAIFVCVTGITLQNWVSVLNIFCAEMEIFFREHQSRMYRSDVYFLCKMLGEAPIYICTPLLFTLICYHMIGLNPEWDRFLIACSIIVLVGNVGVSFGYFVSCSSPDVNVALLVASALNTPLLLLGGFVINVASIPAYLKWFSYLSWFRYANEAMMINQWKNVTHIACSNLQPLCPKTGNIILDNYSYLVENFEVDITALVALFVGYRAMAYFILLFRTFW